MMFRKRLGQRRNGQAGFTLVETMIVVVAMLPLLSVIVMATNSIGKTATANDRAADVRESLRKTIQRIELLVRPGKLSTMKVKATAADVTLGNATYVGEWIDPVDNDPRGNLRFVSAEGLLSMNANLSTLPRELIFTLDSGETANDKDDDGDGFVDEGSLLLNYGTGTQAIVHGLEDCEFSLNGRVLRIEMTAAKRDKSSRIHRARIAQTFYLRNN